MYTQEELMEMIGRMRKIASQTYWMLMWTECHPFIEFNGLMQKYVDICEMAAKKGVQFPDANKHGEVVLPIEEHDMLYLAEKLRCIFGPIIDNNEEARRVLFEGLFGEWRP